MNASMNRQDVKNVDLNRYAGKWYVIACIPTRFDKSWNYVSETYTLNEKGHVEIFTRYKKGDHHAENSLRSKGFPIASSHNVEWKVQFVWPFKAGYLIEELDPEYTYVVVGHPKKKFLYIMNRSGKINPLQYEQILDRAAKKGYNLSELRKVDQGF